MISPVQWLQSHDGESSPRVGKVLIWERFVEQIGFESRVKEWWMMRVEMMTEMSWQVNEEVSRDMTGEVDEMNQGVDFRDGVMHI